MTCIVGIAQDGKVWIGADSASADDWCVRQTKLPKVFKTGNFVVGYTTSFRMGQILQHHLSVRSQYEDEKDDQFMVRAFAEAVRECLKEHGFAKIENNVEKGGTFLVGYRGHIYCMDDDFHVNEHADGYDTCGCGYPFALGAMMALQQELPEARIMHALEIAAHFSGFVKPPFHIEILEK